MNEHGISTWRRQEDSIIYLTCLHGEAVANVIQPVSHRSEELDSHRHIATNRLISVLCAYHKIQNY